MYSNKYTNNVNKYTNNVNKYTNYVNKYTNYVNNFYRYYKLIKIKRQRYKLKQIKNINDCIKFLKSFSNYYCTDYILNKIYILYLYEPPSDIEIQTISILQQKYQNKLNIEEYAITTIWCSIIYYIDNLPKINKQHSW